MPHSATPSTAPKVLVFDSGVGGLSILAELRRALPMCELVFACDNAAFPYGTKDEETLVERVDQVLKALIRKVDPDIVVVACNSASTLVLPRIRSHFVRPVVGVVPAIKPAAAMSQTKCIGLLATPGTVKRQYTQQLIDDFANDCRVVRVGSSELVHLAEEKIRGKAISAEKLQEVLSPLLAETEIDTVVLACTHFPLLKEELSALAKPHIRWIDSGEAIARRVHSLLPSLDTGLPEVQESLAIFTGPHDQLDSMSIGLKNFGCTRIEIMQV
ncbi:glutamate racemase [Porticoccaceae bacterium LTM1]|nr:glutamate racemase [Porticoccaceae bacterium LTM1]